MHTREQPQTVIRKFLLHMDQFIRRHDMIRPGAHLVLGVSGGMDSMAMLDALCQMQTEWRLTISVAHVNFGLRAAASDGDERFVRRAAKKYGLQVYVHHADTKTIARSRKASIQLAAREIRYVFFRDCAHKLGAESIAVAHHAGDNAETMLFNFFRGSGIDGLKGIPISSHFGSVRGPVPSEDHSTTDCADAPIGVIRPLLFADRDEIESYMKARRLRHREDASNDSQDYSRNFIRRSVIPSIEKRINPSLVRTLNTESEIFASCSDFIGSVVNRLESECILHTNRGCSLSVKHLTPQHVFIQRMLVKRSLLLLGIEPNFVHIEEILRLLTGGTGKSIDCGNGIFARRTAAAIEIGRKRTEKPFALNICAGETVTTDAFTFSVRECSVPKKYARSLHVEYVDTSRCSPSFTIRQWRPGDWFIPLGMTSRKKLSDFFTDRKIPRDEKSHIPIVTNGNEIVWVAGMRLDERFKVTSQTQTVYQLSIQFHI